ncbi:hypothetical protein C8R43DRAFT_899359 [Mycena crocata]|nr:hypothetical protein C8R43DRAFT_899359 [Mycena crocata]
MSLQISDEACKLHLEDSDSIEEHIHILMAASVEDFPEDDTSDQAAIFAARIARASITDKTRSNHVRIIKAYIRYHLRRNSAWNAKEVSAQTPKDINMFITQKCGPVADGFEGRKYATAVSTRAALTLWYRTIRPNESIVEWRMDEDTNIWRGLPTRSPEVSRFMIGLEKTKAKAGEVSQSARALSLEDMHRLHDLCLDPKLSVAEQRAGIIRYTAYLLAWLMLLRIEEVVRLEFKSVDVIPGEREYVEISLQTRKSAQTGVTHSWRLYANDLDPKICPMRALIRLAVVYGDTVKLSGPLFLRVNAYGAVNQAQPIVSLGFLFKSTYHFSPPSRAIAS